MTNTPFLYRFRDQIATLPSLLILAILIVAGIQKAQQIKQAAEDPVVQISLAEPEPTLPAPIPNPITPTPPTPAPQPVSKPISTPTVEQKAATATPSAEVAAAVPTPVVHAAPVTTTAPPIATPAPAEPPQPNNLSVEANSVAQLRAHLNAIKRYPTGREASQQKPRGKVKVWFVLNRKGVVLEQGIEESSNNILLDDAARKTINRASFSELPESGWAGEASHKFSAELEFIPAG